MSTSLLRRARDARLLLWRDGEHIRYRGPDTPEVRALLVDVAAQKAKLLAALEPSPLAEEAARVAPTIRLTMRETPDEVTDIRWLRAIRRAIASQQPGGNRIVLTVVTLDGRRVRVEWRAVASPGLRRRIARLLAARATEPALKECPL